ncbi:hypothetical protein PXD04_11475 (plasmid) [Methanosphaera sp. ISO3-F5]|uniref:hypothetical protein n=1 Tax=Methanosphaera sp. ISO3-F5 TaxID=1452353 RepID=UPI002B260DEF|nr:hypothetical protein [Methanosphaera sp. ISO3-F5]WQH65362.1 hypothetical protein PXD04_11475 [Methanosphaera sp. ISO3-F5]
MIKIEKTLLFIIVLVLFVGAVSATETPQEDQSYTNDDTVVSDISTVSQDNKETIKFEEKNLMDDNPIKIGESKTRSIEKKTKDTNLKQDGIIEVHNYTELENAVNNASSTGVDTTIRLLQGSYNNTETITWNTGGMVLTIDGNGQTINGHQQQVFYINGASMILKNITITNATSSYGGAIDNNDGTLTVSNSTFNNNQAGLGGTISNYVGTLTVSNSTFNNNQATKDGGAIHNYYATLTVSNSTFNNNQATKNGGAIYNDYGLLTITNSQFLNNQAFGGIGGAIYNRGDSPNKLTNIISSNFINNTASNGAAINALRWINLTNNTFKQNTATNNTETIDLNSWLNGIHEDNIYESTDIALNEIKLTIKDDQDTFQQDENIILNYTIQLTNPMHYKDFETGINDITLYINSQKNITTKYENTTLNNLQPGKYEIYYTTCNQQSNTVTFKVIGDSQITTPEDSYEYYEGINNKIPLLITDASGQKGNITITVKDQDEYKLLSAYYNIGNNYQLPTESLASTLKNLYNPLSDSYTINVTYSSDCANPSSTEFTLNITKQRNTTIAYDIINNTEKNVQINITVQDSIYKTPIADATIFYQDEYKLLSAYYNIGNNYQLPTESLASTLKNLYNPLSDSYTINVTYSSDCANPSSTEFTLNITKQRNTTIAYDIINNTEKNVQINITVQDSIYKTPIADATIQITGDINTDTTSGILTDNTLTPGDYTINVKYPETEDYKESQTTIDFTVEIDKDKKIAELEEQVENITEKLDEAQDNIENLTNQLERANNEIETLNNTNNNLTRQLEEANQKIDSLNNQISNLTQKIKEKDNQIENLTEQITDLTKQLQDAQKEIQTLTQENNNLNNQLEQAKEEIETLNNTIKELTRPPLNTTITITPIKSSVGSIVNLSANVKDQNGEKVSGGKVIFKVNGITLKDEYNNVLYATLTDGCASLKYKVQAAWMKNTSYVEAVYGGNENYTSSRTKSTNILNITEGTAKVSLDKSSFTVKSGEKITLRAKIVDANGDNINRGKVVFKLNGKTLTDKNGKTLQAKVVNGEAVLEYTIPSTYSAKTYNLTAVYGGEGYTRSQTSGKLTITKKGVIINTDSITTKNNKTTLKATIRDETGELLVRNTNLAIKVNGKTILKGVNSTNGKIDLSFTTTLRPGMYELQIISGENGIYKTGKMTTVLKI